MIIKLLGALDVLIAVFLFVFLKYGTISNIFIILVILLMIKSLITIKDVFSVLDLISSIIIIAALLSFTNVLVWIVFFWLLIKGSFTLVSSV